MGLRFTDELRRDADSIWRAQHAHPFVRGLADGSLKAERFDHFVRQDALFLDDYVRALELAARLAPDDDTAQRFAKLAETTGATELGLHRSFGLELDAADPAPATRAYTDFLLTRETFDELAAALLPCMWGYSELGRALAAGPRPPVERYARWIDLYASGEFAELAEWCRDVVDAHATPETRGRMRTAFLESSRHELEFFEASYALGSSRGVPERG